MGWYLYKMSSIFQAWFNKNSFPHTNTHGWSVQLSSTANRDPNFLEVDFCWTDPLCQQGLISNTLNNRIYCLAMEPRGYIAAMVVKYSFWVWGKFPMARWLLTIGEFGMLNHQITAHLLQVLFLKRVEGELGSYL